MDRKPELDYFFQDIRNATVMIKIFSFSFSMLDRRFISATRSYRREFYLLTLEVIRRLYLV